MAIGEVEVGACQRECPADHLEAAGHDRAFRGTADMQVTAELGVQPAPLHEDLSWRVQLQIQADHELALRRRGWRLAGATHVEYRNLRGKRVWDTDECTVNVDHTRDIETLTQRS